MTKKFNFCALMALVVMGVVFTSCTNVDNPYNVTPPDGKYVLLKDSVVYSDGIIINNNYEYDAEGRVVKELTTTCYTDGTTEQMVCSYAYSPNLITNEQTLSDGNTEIYNFKLNDKGLVEQLEAVSENTVYGYRYNDDDQLIIFTDNEVRDTSIWKNGDVVSCGFNLGLGVKYYTYTNYEVNFPYLMNHISLVDLILAQTGYFGKPSRHLISNYHFDIEDIGDGFSAHRSDDYSYIVRNGLVMEYEITSDYVVIRDGVTYDLSHTEHHYITWKKL